MPAVLPPIVHHVELESEIDCDSIWQRQHQSSFLGVEDGLAIALNSALAHGKSLDLAGQRLAGCIPAELAWAQLLALQPGPDFYKLGFDFLLLAAAGLGQGGELILLVAKDPFELEVLHWSILEMRHCPEYAEQAGADEKLDYLDIVHAFLRRSNPSS